MSDPFCPRHGRKSRPIEVPGLRCDCLEDRVVPQPEPCKGRPHMVSLRTGLCLVCGVDAQTVYKEKAR